MAGDEWIVGDGDAGVRLDKFLAHGARLGSRGRAVLAIDRGKVFVNDTEAVAADAARRLVAGDVVRTWLDRPGSARRRPRTGKSGELDIVFDEATHTFGYVQPEHDKEPIELSPEPNWQRVAYSRR